MIPLLDENGIGICKDFTFPVNNTSTNRFTESLLAPEESIFCDIIFPL